MYEQSLGGRNGNKPNVRSKFLYNISNGPQSDSSSRYNFQHNTSHLPTQTPQGNDIRMINGARQAGHYLLYDNKLMNP